MQQPFNGLLVQYNNAGTWQAAVVTNVQADSLIDILHLTTVATSRTSIPFNESGATSTCRPAPRQNG